MLSKQEMKGYESHVENKIRKKVDKAENFRSMYACAYVSRLKYSKWFFWYFEQS